MQLFSSEAEEDAATVMRLLTALKGIEPMRVLASYGDIEAKAVTVHGIGVQGRQLQEKYAAAATADEKIREHLRSAALARSQ